MELQFERVIPVELYQKMSKKEKKEVISRMQITYNILAYKNARPTDDIGVNRAPEFFDCYQRVNKAKKELQKYEEMCKSEFSTFLEIEKITKLVNDLLYYFPSNCLALKLSLDEELVELNKRFEIKPIKLIEDEKEVDFIKQTYKDDVIWMKFASNGMLCGVYNGCKVNFDIPQNFDDYFKIKTDKNGKEKGYLHNSAGVLTHYLGLNFDYSYIVAIPISELPNNKKEAKSTRNFLTTIIGNYLQQNNIPMIDYYSHRYLKG